MPPKINDGFSKHQRFRKRRAASAPAPGRPVKYHDGLSSQERNNAGKSGATLPKQGGAIVVSKAKRQKLLGSNPPSSLVEISLNRDEYRPCVSWGGQGSAQVGGDKGLRKLGHQTTPDQARPGQARPDHTRPDQICRIRNPVQIQNQLIVPRLSFCFSGFS
jgi:hypothetical protein